MEIIYRKKNKFPGRNVKCMYTYIIITDRTFKENSLLLFFEKLIEDFS